MADELAVFLEVIVVDWNSPANRVGVAKRLMDLGVQGTRVIEVSSALATSQLAIPFLEHQAKNVGIRRARGSQIAILNDVEISETLFSACTSRPHLWESFLRADRTHYISTPGKRRIRSIDVQHGSSLESPIDIRYKWYRRRYRTHQIQGAIQVGAFSICRPQQMTAHFMRCFRQMRLEISYAHRMRLGLRQQVFASPLFIERWATLLQQQPSPDLRFTK